MNSYGKALWVVKELGLPTIIKACVTCRTTRHHHPTGKFRINANGKLLDVWMLISCDHCDRTSKIPVHERINVKDLDHERLLTFENNSPALVRDLTMDAALMSRAAHRLDWTGTWELETDMPFHDIRSQGRAPLEVLVRFELPVPVRVERLLMAGFRLSRSAVRDLVGSGRIRLPRPLDAKAHEDFTLFVTSDGS
ncbi:DUF1062 domain-containing protein [Actinoplanes sp. NPDC051494]|uniref:DUF1062 domain-containing protein n=1 Tax=Actinoplanes sp. NPDC051494 TaxID=3363907 RepID=UPI0037B25C5E